MDENTKEQVELHNRLLSLDRHDREIIIFALLREGHIDFNSLSRVYVASLERLSKHNDCLISEYAQCLATKYQNSSIMDARSKLLLSKYVPDEFLKRYFKKVSKKDIDREMKYLQNI